MKLAIREQLLSEHRTAALLKRALPDRNVMKWLQQDRAASPILKCVVHRGVPHYFATEVFRFAQGIAKDPAVPYLIALEMGLERRMGNERRFGERRRRVSDMFLDVAAANDRRQTKDRRGH